ncbi:MAG: response regulator [Bacteroidales bacterium]|nr:response regulator [Bacteroidales bacterium]
MLEEKRFLVVDDLVMNRILLCEILDSIGCKYEEAKNGKEALEKLLKSKFDIVLMDIEMPVMNGIEATREIGKNQSKYNNVKVIGVTAHDPNRFASDFEAVTFDGFVTKPYTIQRLKVAIDNLFPPKV